MLVSVVLTVVIYLLSIWMLPQYMGVAYLDWNFFLNVFVLTITVWAPFHLFKVLMKKANPSEEDRLL